MEFIYHQKKENLAWWIVWEETQNIYQGPFRKRTFLTALIWLALRKGIEGMKPHYNHIMLHSFIPCEGPVSNFSEGSTVQKFRRFQQYVCQGGSTPYIGDGHPTFHRESL